MESDTAKTNQNNEIRMDIESLPPEVQTWCLSGKSVEELAHLAKNIIQTVSGSAEIMELGLEKKRYDYVQRSWDVFEPNLKQLTKFVLDLIKYTRHYPPQKTACDLNILVQRVIDRNEWLLKKYGVTFRFIKDDTLPLIQLDADQISEMAANLTTHSLDNLPEHTGAISIETKYLSDHNQIQLSVSDNGPALSDEAIRALASPTERTRDMCGTGFDVPLAKLTVEQHGGYMEFESTPQSGNSVHVYLPIQFAHL